MKPAPAVKSFLRSRLGFILLIALTIAVVVVTYTFVGGPLLAIVAILVFGLGLPIWVGINRPRTLAIVGVVILVASAPLITLVETSGILTPIGPASSSTITLTNGTNGAVLQNAVVSPFVAEPGGTFTWNVSVFPMFLPNGSGGSDRVLWMDLYVSTCFGATGNNSPNCNAGYPLYIEAHSFNGTVVANNTPVSFEMPLNGYNIWGWQMGIAYRNSTGNITWTFLVGDPTYNGLEGPITGDYWSTYGLLIGSIYVSVLFYLGAVFYIVLLIYMLFSGRKRKALEMRARAEMPPPQPPGAATAARPAAPPPPGATPLTPIAEAACPNCSAVVYPGEKVCWKCGVRLSSPPSSGDAPLPSTPK